MYFSVSGLCEFPQTLPAKTFALSSESCSPYSKRDGTVKQQALKAKRHGHVVSAMLCSSHLLFLAGSCSATLSDFPSN